LDHPAIISMVISPRHTTRTLANFAVQNSEVFPRGIDFIDSNPKPGIV
jgi:alpha-D-ribose 1-methylphosphonate 5-triphosphate synthase subunit PhnH